LTGNEILFFQQFLVNPWLETKTYFFSKTLAGNEGLIFLVNP